MQVRAEDLSDHLRRGMAPLYAVHGDEPLLVLEAGDAIRAAARAGGSADREVFVVETSFRWDAFLAANNNRGLFGDRKLLDLRVTSGKPGVEGGKALEALAADPNPDNVVLVSLPRLDRAAQSSAWFEALGRAGVTVAVYPVERDALPAWIAARMKRNGQHVSRETLAFLADTFEGNLLAARQEIDKLALLMPQGEIAFDAIEAAVADVARYDVFLLSEAWLAGDAVRVLRILNSLQSEGDAPIPAIWQLVEDVHAIAAVHSMVRSGSSIPSAIKNVRVWGKRQNALERAVNRVAPASLPPLLLSLARLDALSKGLGRGDAWDMLADVALQVCGKPAMVTTN
jgi:DNA polymerase III subunit delta